MRRTIRTYYWVAPALVCLLAASCAHSPRMMDETEDIRGIRSNYFESNPDGPFNEFIARGEVAKGMSFMEVLAAWGVPIARVRESDKKLDYWLYLSEDAESGNWVRYTFIFEKTKLVDWEMARHVSKNAALVYWEPKFPIVHPPASPTAALKR